MKTYLFDFDGTLVDSMPVFGKMMKHIFGERASGKTRACFELCRKEDIDELRGQFPVTQLHFVASDGYTNHMRQTVDAMDDKTYEVYLNYHFATCERLDMVGYSHHTIDIFRKD